MKIGLSISTHSSEETPIERLEIIKECLDSIPSSIYVNVVADGVIDQHKKLLDQYSFDVVYKENKGISYTKNTGIKKILDNGCDVGFLMDDDMIIKDPSVFDKYIESMDKTGIPHFSFYVDKKSCEELEYNGYKILKSPMVNGCLLTFTKELIEKIGYFKIMSYKYGHEHSNFTRRCLSQGEIPFFCDILNSSDYLTINPKSWTKRSIINYSPSEMKKNELEAISNLNRYEPFID